MNLNQVTVPTQDVSRSISFYQKLGLELIVHTHDRYARFQCPEGESTFSLHYVEEMPVAGVWIYFEVENVAEKVKGLSEIGMVFESEATDQPWLWTEARMKDPDGNTLIIYHAGENRKNPPWRIQDP